MRTAALVAGLVAGGAVVVVMMRQASATPADREEGAPADFGATIANEAAIIFDSVTGGPLPLDTDMYDRNLRAFLLLIRSGESSLNDDAYRMLYGGDLFASFDDHPRIMFDAPGGRRTSAAGAYQITKTTWDDLRRAGLDLPDFSPANQDRAAVALIKRRRALDDVFAGRFDAAITKCQKEWTSLPGAYETRYSLAEAHRRLLAYGGTFEGTVA